jgi:hypothetical protein
MKPFTRIAGVALSALLLTLPGLSLAFAGDEPKKVEKPKLVDCEMTFDLKGWSAFYKTASGEGTIHCDNGQSAKVKIRTKGGGITFGKSDIIGGTGKFSGARSIDELFGSYVQSEAHAGAGKSASAQAMTKGEISLAIAGTGRGVDIGFDFGKFTIER